MNRTTRTGLVLVLVLALAGLGAWWALAPHGGPPSQPPQAAGEAEAGGIPTEVSLSAEARAGIQVAVARMAPVEDVVQVTGTLRADPDRKVQITARAGGTVSAYHGSLGDWIARGAPVVTLDSPEVARARGDHSQAQRQVDLARANLEREKRLAGLGALTRDPVESARREAASARADVAEAQAQRDVARSQLARVEELQAEEVVSRRDYELARAELLAAEARLQAAREILGQHRSRLEREEKSFRAGYLADRVLQQLQGELAQKEQSLLAAGDALTALGAAPGAGGRITLTAPADGVLVARTATVGQAVEGSAPLAELLDNRTLWAVLDFYEKDVTRVREGVPVQVVPASGGPGARGRLSYISPQVEPEGRTVEGWVQLVDPPRLLREGMFVTGRAEVGSGRQAVILPKEALQKLEGQDVVFVEDSPGKYQRRPVKVGASTSEGAEIREGLKAGERVVVAGSFVIKSEFLRQTIGGEE